MHPHIKILRSFMSFRVPTTLFDLKILSDAKLEGFVAQIMVVRYR